MFPSGPPAELTSEGIPYGVFVQALINLAFAVRVQPGPRAHGESLAEAVLRLITTFISPRFPRLSNLMDADRFRRYACFGSNRRCGCSVTRRGVVMVGVVMVGVVMVGVVMMGVVVVVVVAVVAVVLLLSFSQHWCVTNVCVVS